MESLPKSIVIMGAGAIGVEFAYFLNALATLRYGNDGSYCAERCRGFRCISSAFKKQKISVHTSTRSKISSWVRIVSMNLVKGRVEKKEVEAVLLAMAEAHTEGLFSR